MNYLVFLDPSAGELEKILSGIKSMVVKDFDATQPAAQQVRPGDSLYFLRDKDGFELRVKANVTRVLCIANHAGEDLAQRLKEFQHRLKLTEEQYNRWSNTGQVLLVEFEQARKIEVIQVAANKVTDRSDWIAFEEISLVTE